jgi:hypothetical protein
MAEDYATVNKKCAARARKPASEAVPFPTMSSMDAVALFACFQQDALEPTSMPQTRTNLLDAVKSFVGSRDVSQMLALTRKCLDINSVRKVNMSIVDNDYAYGVVSARYIIDLLTGHLSSMLAKRPSNEDKAACITDHLVVLFFSYMMWSVDDATKWYTLCVHLVMSDYKVCCVLCFVFCVLIYDVYPLSSPFSILLHVR